MKISIFIASMLLLATNAAAADFVVIVNVANKSRLDQTVVSRIYQGNLLSWPSGGPVTALDLPEENSARTEFSKVVLGKSVSSVKALWAKNVFSGRCLPPRVMGSDEDVIRAVVKNKNAIGYIRASSLDSSVKVVPDN